MTQQNLKLTPRFIIALFFALLAAVIGLSVFNWQLVSINLFSFTMNLPFGLCIVIAFLSGSVATWSAYLSLHKKKESIKTQVNWQAQDAKLIAEMVGDKERLLQAKIDTLESALKTALKNQN